MFSCFYLSEKHAGNNLLNIFVNSISVRICYINFLYFKPFFDESTVPPAVLNILNTSDQLDLDQDVDDDDY